MPKNKLFEIGLLKKGDENGWNLTKIPDWKKLIELRNIINYENNMKIKCSKCSKEFEVSGGFCGTIVCEDCDPAMQGYSIHNQHTHFYRFLDYLGVKKDEATFYCQICLDIKKIKCSVQYERTSNS